VVLGFALPLAPLGSLGPAVLVVRKAEGLPVCLVYLVYLVQGSIRHYRGT